MPVLKQAIEDAGRMAAAEPAVFDCADWLTQVLASDALIMERIGRPERAIEDLDRIVVAFSPWVDLQAQRDYVSRSIARAHLESARLLANQGKYAEAARSCTKALKFSQPADRLWVRLSLARILFAAGNRPAAWAVVGAAAVEATQFLGRVRVDSSR